MNMKNLSPAVFSQFLQFKTQQGRINFLEIKIKSLKDAYSLYRDALLKKTPIMGECVTVYDVLGIGAEIKEMESLKSSLCS